MKDLIIADISAWCKITFTDETSHPLCKSNNGRILINSSPGLDSLIIPDDITKINNFTFYNCKNINTVKFPDKLTTIGEAAFYGCDGLIIVYPPKELKIIKKQAFYGCKLNSITIPTDVEFIYQEAFANCNDLMYVKALPQTPPILYDNSFSNYSVPLEVPKGCKETYQLAQGWKNFKNIITAGDIYKLVYMVDGEEYASYSVEEGSPITPEPAPTKEGYTFSGWSELPKTMPAHDVTVSGTFSLTYPNGQCETKLKFQCKTKGVDYVSTISDKDIKTYTGDEITLTATYSISVYAKADGYKDSEVATATLCWIDAEPWAEGTKEAEDNVTEVKAMPVLIQAEGNIISVQGAVEGTEISVYNTAGIKLNSAIANNGITKLNTTLPSGSTAIVKIGEKSVKVVVK